MGGQDKLTRRKQLRTERDQERRRAMFIAEYVKAKHTDVYIEASRCYNTIRGRNPDKKDARKTDDFTRLTTHYRSRRAYYHRHRHVQPPNRQQYHDNLRLNIELIHVETETRTTQPETQPEETQPETQPEETQPETQPEETQPETQPEETQPETQSEETQPETQFILPDHVFAGLLDEIRNDPDLNLIFNRWQQPPEGEDNNIDCGPTPLELELTQLGF